MTDLTTLAREVFAHDLYATELTGIAIESVEPDKVVCSLALDSHHRNAKGAVMGGAIFTLADFAFAIAANIDALNVSNKADQVRLQWVSSSSTIHFLAQAKGDKLTATTSTVKKGHSQSLIQISVTDSLTRQIALVTTTGTKID